MQPKRLPLIESGYSMYVSCMIMRSRTRERKSVHDYTKRERERETMVMR